MTIEQTILLLERKIQVQESSLSYSTDLGKATTWKAIRQYEQRIQELKDML